MENKEIVIELRQEPFPHAIIKNFYNKEELSLIWRELDFYTHPSKLIDAIELSGARDKLTGMPLPKHYGLSLDVIYEKCREISDILTVNRKVFHSSIINTLCELSPLVWDLKQINRDFTKIKYYENGDYYKPHTDNARFTFLTYLHKEPKAFTGGDLHFPQFNYTIPLENNMLVFFKGCIEHASTELKMTNYIDQRFSGYGKYTITQFGRVENREYENKSI
jgi:hypothetical protein